MREDCDHVARPVSSPESEEPTGYPTELERQVTLDDGRVVFVRPIVPGDIDGLRAAIAGADVARSSRPIVSGIAQCGDDLVHCCRGSGRTPS